ncbi:MAG: sulfurtransferase TusA family protein [Deltaproteobacteria bacterium]|nr:sulfurtransferase TusA family protein [Deltaproteobacteria bacterium]
MATKTLDVRGEICPDPLTLTLKEMRGLAIGDQLKVIVDSPMALETISRWAQNAGHRLVGINEFGAGQWEMTIERVV